MVSLLVYGFISFCFFPVDLFEMMVSDINIIIYAVCYLSQICRTYEGTMFYLSKPFFIRYFA